jgi:hypothetical protein
MEILFGSNVPPAWLLVVVGAVLSFVGAALGAWYRSPKAEKAKSRGISGDSEVAGVVVYDSAVRPSRNEKKSQSDRPADIQVAPPPIAPPLGPSRSETNREKIDRLRRTEIQLAVRSELHSAQRKSFWPTFWLNLGTNFITNLIFFAIGVAVTLWTTQGR